MNSTFTGIDNPLFDNYNSIYTFLTNTSLTIGDYKYSASNTEQNGWLLCNGQSLAVSDYPDLYTVIGTNFGTVGAGYFNLPDFTGRVPAVPGNANSENALDDTHEFGDSIGADNVILTEAQMPTHNHGGTTGNRTTGISAADSGHTHSYSVSNNQNQNVGYPAGGGSPNVNAGLSGATTGTGNANIVITDPGHNHTIANDGSSQKHNNVQPTLYGGNIFIFAKYITYLNSRLRGMPYY